PRPALGADSAFSSLKFALIGASPWKPPRLPCPYYTTSYCTLARHTFKRSAKRWRFSVFQPLCVPGMTWTSTSFTPVALHHSSLREAPSVDQKSVILSG